MIKLTGRLICKSREEADLIRHYLPEHINLTTQEAGCVTFSVTQTADPLIWQVEEQFTDKQSFEAHQKRTRASLWGKASRVITREYEITEL